MFGKFTRTFAAATVAASAIFGAFAFSAGTPAASAQTGQAQLRVIHASPDAPAVDIYVNGNKAISNLAFKETTPWTALPAGSYDVKVTAAGGTDAVIEANLPLEAGKYYSVVATGKLADISAKVFMDDLSMLESGKARLRVIHVSPDAPAVDVAAKGGAVLVPNLAYPNASDYLTVDAMTVDVEVRAAGTNTVALAVPGLNLSAGNIYTIYAVGLLNGSPALGVLPVVDSGMSMAAASGAGMPATGAGDNIFALAVLAVILAAGLVAGGTFVRGQARRSSLSK